MNTATNELYDLSKMTDKEKKKLMDNLDVKEVPIDLQNEAISALRGKRKSKASYNGNLATWAKRVRANNGIELQIDAEGGSI